MPKISLKKKTKSKSKSKEELTDKRLGVITQLYLLSIGKNDNDRDTIRNSLNELSLSKKKDILDRYRLQSMSNYKLNQTKPKSTTLNVDNSGIYTFDKAHNVNKDLKRKKNIEKINKEKNLTYTKKSKPKTIRKKNQAKNPNIPKIKIISSSGSSKKH